MASVNKVMRIGSSQGHVVATTVNPRFHCELIPLSPRIARVRVPTVDSCHCHGLQQLTSISLLTTSSQIRATTEQGNL